MSEDLTTIKGIGPSAAKKYAAAGFDTIESIALAETDALAKVPGVGKSRASAVIASAKQLMNETPTAAAPVETAKPKPEVSPAVGPAPKSRFKFIGNPTIAIPVGVALGVAVLAFMKTDDVPSTNAAATSEAVSATIGTSQNLYGMNRGVVSMESQDALTRAPQSIDATNPGYANQSQGGYPYAGANAAYASQQQGGYPYYAPYPYSNYTGWNDSAYGYGNGSGNAYGNAGMAVDMNANANANSNIAGQGYGYNNPYYYGSPYAYGPYWQPYPAVNPPAMGTQTLNPN